MCLYLCLYFSSGALAGTFLGEGLPVAEVIGPVRVHVVAVWLHQGNEGGAIIPVGLQPTLASWRRRVPYEEYHLCRSFRLMAHAKLKQTTFFWNLWDTFSEGQ